MGILGAPRRRMALPSKNGLSRAPHWGRFSCRGGLGGCHYRRFSSLLAQNRRVVSAEASDGFDRSLPTGVACPIGPRHYDRQDRCSHQLRGTLSRDLQRTFQFRCLLRRYARGVQTGRYGASRPKQRRRNDGPLSSAATIGVSNQAAVQIKLGHQD
jgi:hypothetical protein